MKPLQKAYKRITVLAMKLGVVEFYQRDWMGGA